MRLRAFNDHGVDAFGAFLDRLVVAPAEPVPVGLLEDDSRTIVVEPAVDVQPLPFRDRMELAAYLHARLEALADIDLPRASGLWSWLTLLLFDQLCPADRNGHRKPGVQRATWIPMADVTRRFYRHALLGPYLAHRAHRDDPSRAAVLLADPLHVTTSEGFRLFIETPFVNMRAPVDVATRLYYDPERRRLRRGAGTKGPGGIRRFLQVLQQLDLTWDMQRLDAAALMGLLPAAEFAKWDEPRND